jgi:hypothetical protein
LAIVLSPDLRRSKTKCKTNFRTTMPCAMPSFLVQCVLLICAPLSTGMLRTIINQETQLLTSKLTLRIDKCYLNRTYLNLRINGGGEIQTGQRSVVVNLLSPEEQLLRKKYQEAHQSKTNETPKRQDSERTRRIKDGVREIARYSSRIWLFLYEF